MIRWTGLAPWEFKFGWDLHLGALAVARGHELAHAFLAHLDPLPCVCVCVCERERERERVCVCVC